MKILKEKIGTGEVCDNVIMRKRLTIYEKLTEHEIHTIRQQIHSEFQKFKKVAGEGASKEARFPTIKILHDNIQEGFEEDWSWSLSTTERIVKTMGFRFLRPHNINYAVLIGNVLL